MKTLNLVLNGKWYDMIAADMERAMNDWRVSDAKMDALHIKEIGDLKAKAANALCSILEEYGHGCYANCGDNYQKTKRITQ